MEMRHVVSLLGVMVHSRSCSLGFNECFFFNCRHSRMVPFLSAFMIATLVVQASGHSPSARPEANAEVTEFYSNPQQQELSAVGIEEQWRDVSFNSLRVNDSWCHELFGHSFHAHARATGGMTHDVPFVLSAGLFGQG